ncbi:MAG: Coq4 family protein [Alphaproteobacteria bacterium]
MTSNNQEQEFDMPTGKNKILWGEAWRAYKRLIKDIDNTAEVFVIIRSLTGESFNRSYRKFVKTAHGQKILRDKRRIIDFLSDRTPFKTLPAGTLGHTYDAFMTHEGLSAEGLAQASEDGTLDKDRAMAFKGTDLETYGDWVRDTHDLYHVTTGYGRDEVGELCLLSFTFAQSGNWGIGFIVLMGALQMKRVAPSAPAFGLIWEGFRNGRRAKWLPAQDWEAKLDQPLDDVRRDFGIHWPQKYHAVIKAIRAGADTVNLRAGSQSSVEKDKVMDEAFVPIAPDLAVI